MKIFAGQAHTDLGMRISNHLQLELGKAEIRTFPDGETKVRILEDVRGCDVFILQPTCPPANQNLMELLILIDAIKRSSASRVTAVIPYYGYARQDRKHEGRVPISAKLVANMIATAGADRVLCMDLHANQIQGFFDIPVDHLYGLPLFSRYIKNEEIQDPVVVAPDVGSVKKAEDLSHRLGCGLAIVEKRRISDTEVAAGHMIGDVSGKHAILIDDMISTGGSMASAIEILWKAGAESIDVLATHSLFVGSAVEKLLAKRPSRIITTDTIPFQDWLNESQKQALQEELSLEVLSVAPLFAEAINRIHKDESISVLFA